MQSILTHYSTNITDALLMITRILTILFTLLFLVPFGGGIAFYKYVAIQLTMTYDLRVSHSFYCLWIGRC